MQGFVRPKDRTLDKAHTKLRAAPLPWGEAYLSGRWIRSCCRKLGHRWRERTWGPVLAFWSCVLQQMRGGASARWLEHLACLEGYAEGLAARDGADFVRARRRLRAALFQTALWKLGADLKTHAQLMFGEWRVAFVDGIVCRAPRTKPNLAACGSSINWTGRTRWPLVRAVLLVCGGTGQILAMDLGGFQDSERKLLRGLLDRRRPACLSVADRGFCSLMALWYVQQQAGHLLCRLHQTRRKRRWQPIGSGDYLCCGPKKGLRCTRCAEWRAWALRVEQDLWVRVSERTLLRPGYTPLRITLVTTLCDPQRYAADHLVALDVQRWGSACDFRTRKGDYGVRRLTAKSPQTVRNEVLSAAVAFSLVALEKAHAGGAQARRLSSRMARLLVLDVVERTQLAAPVKRRELRERLLHEIRLACVPIQERPPEPRAIVHYARRYPNLKVSREQWRSEYLKCSA